MLAPPVAKAHMKAAASSTSKPTFQRSMLVAHRLGHQLLEHTLQPAIGNQAPLMHLAQRARSLTGYEHSDEHKQEADQVVLEAPVATWDFSKIPDF